jgi:hypothetical protein
MVLMTASMRPESTCLAVFRVQPLSLNGPPATRRRSLEGYNCYTAGVRFHFDRRKSERLRGNPKRGIGFEEAQELFSRPYYQDNRSDLPEQHRAIGWVDERLYTPSSLKCARTKRASSIIWSPCGRQLVRSEHSMKKTRNAKRKPATAESIARMADEGKDVSRFFTNSGRMVSPVQRVNVDFTAPMLEELDRQAQELNVSRQAVIKTLLRQGLDQHYASTASRQVDRNHTAPRE